MYLKTILFIICTYALFMFAQGQTVSDTTIVRIETTDGNEFLGKIAREDSARIFLETKNYDIISIQKEFIKSFERVDANQIKNDRLWFPNPQATRYFWSPNGYGLQKGEGYYQNIWVLWNQFAYGISNNISVGGGIVPLFLFAGAPTPVFGTLKVSLPLEKEKVNIGFGGIFGTVLGESESALGIVYGISTFGTPDNNVSLGVGYGYTFGEWASSPLININGMFRISSRGYIITENYYINTGGDDFFVLTFGGRWIIKKAALDFGLAMPGGTGEFIAIPLLGFTIPFGNTN